MIFETDRLIIRDFIEDDVKIIHELTGEPDIYKYQHWGPNTEDDTKNFVKMSLQQQVENPRLSYEMAITCKESALLFGAIGIRVKSINYKKADIGYWVRKDQWGKGLATEATKGLLHFGFMQLGMNKISATTSPDNAASIKVLEKSGMKKEGFLKSDMFVRGTFRDSVLMAVLKDEIV